MKLFVYGTLKRGWHNNHLLQEAIFLYEAVTITPYVLFNCGFPKAVALTGDKTPLPVMGEVYDINEQILARCDRLEGHPNWYVRETVSVVTTKGVVKQVFMYIMPEWQSQPVCDVVDGCYVYKR